MGCQLGREATPRPAGLGEAVDQGDPLTPAAAVRDDLRVEAWVPDRAGSGAASGPGSGKDRSGGSGGISRREGRR